MYICIYVYIYIYIYIYVHTYLGKSREITWRLDDSLRLPLKMTQLWLAGLTCLKSHLSSFRSPILPSRHARSAVSGRQVWQILPDAERRWLGAPVRTCRISHALLLVRNPNMFICWINCYAIGFPMASQLPVELPSDDPRLLLGMVGLLGSSCLQLLAPPLVSAALMAVERGAKAAQAQHGRWMDSLRLEMAGDS